MNRFGVLNLVIAIGLVASSIATDCKGDGKFIKDCCTHDSLITKEIYEKCEALKENNPTPTEEEEGPGGPGWPRGRKHNFCYKECLVNGTGILNDNHEVDEGKLKKYLPQAMSESPQFIPIAHSAFLACDKKAKEIRAKMEKDHPHPKLPPGECKPCSAVLLECVQIEIVMNCPANDWKKDEQCDSKRESFKTDCKHPHPHPHPHPHH